MEADKGRHPSHSIDGTAKRRADWQSWTSIQKCHSRCQRFHDMGKVLDHKWNKSFLTKISQNVKPVKGIIQICMLWSRAKAVAQSRKEMLFLLWLLFTIYKCRLFFEWNVWSQSSIWRLANLLLSKKEQITRQPTTVLNSYKSRSWVIRDCSIHRRQTCEK